jgi:EmrB/QacA subfamily drug resistance transporter
MHLRPQENDPTALDLETLIVVGVVLLGAVMSVIDTTVVTVAIGRLSLDFNASFTTIQWAITGYTLALAAVIPITGWASDRFGTKRIYIGAVAAFTLGSVLCALAWNAESLIAFRVLQGAGGGMVLPAITTIITQKAGPHRRGRVMGILGVPLLAAPILGPILGGWIIDSVSWRWIFLINVPIGIVAILLALLVLDRDEPQPAHRLDWLGMALLSPGLTLIIFGSAESPANGLGATESWLPIAIGAALITAFFRHSWRAREPLIDVKTFVRTSAGPAAAANMLMSISLFAWLLLVPLYFQAVRGASALEAGLLLAPQGVGAMLAMPLAGWIVDRHDPRALPIWGLPVLLVGTIPFALLTADTSYLLLSVFTFVQGVGLGLTFMPLMAAAMRAVPAAAIARTSTAMNIIEQSAASIGTAIFSVLLASATTAQLGAGRVPSDGFGALTTLSDGQRQAIAEPLASAFASTFIWALVLLALATIPAAALALSRHRRRGGARPDAGHVVLE